MAFLSVEGYDAERPQPTVRGLMPVNPNRSWRDEDSECLGSTSVSESSRETLLCDSDDEISTDLHSSSRTAGKELDGALIDDIVDTCLPNASRATNVKFSRLFSKQRVHPHSTLPISTTVALESTAPSPPCAITAEALIGTIDASDKELAFGAAFRQWPGSESMLAGEDNSQPASVRATSKSERRQWRACLYCNKLFNFNKVLCSGDRKIIIGVMCPQGGRASDADVPKL
jgi:hypothetical protein